MKKSRILKKVQERMEVLYQECEHGYLCICNVVIGVVGRQYVTHKLDVWSEGLDIVNDIRVRLGKYYTLEEWLAHGDKVNKELLTPENMYEYRQRFVAHLIKQYKAKGE